jgi:DNA-binding response OmpR family regulator
MQPIRCLTSISTLSNTMAKIVVLEDDASTRRLITAVLKKAGHEVTDVDNGAEGLLIVMAEQPDIVVSDVEMPKMTGFEVLQNIRLEPETADTPVILLTSLSSRADIRKGMSHGADDYITKPFEPAELIESVNAQIAKLAVRRGHSAPSSFGFLQTAPTDLELSPLPTLSLDTIDLELVPADALMQTPASVPVPPPYIPPPSRPVGNAWALNLRVLNHEAVQALLSVKDWRLLLRQLFVPVSKDAALKAADYLDLVDSSLTLYFLDQAQEGRSGAARAALAVEAMVRSGAMCRQWAAGQFPALASTPVRVVVSLHLGPIEIMNKPLDFGGERETVVGETADLIARLRGGEPALMWRVAATQAALQASTQGSKGLYRQGAQMEVEVGSQDVNVYALLGLNGDPGVGERVDAAHWV